MLDPRTEDPVKAVRGFTRGFGADGVILGVVDTVERAAQPVASRCPATGASSSGWASSAWTSGARGCSTTTSTSSASRAYGPGRYDPVYEEGNVDFPIGYVRWTENRNQQEFLRELSRWAPSTVDELAPIRVPIAEAPRA